MRYREGQIKKPAMSKLEKALVILVFAFECNPTLAVHNLPQYAILALLFISLITRETGITVRINSFSGCFILFALWCAATLAWSVSLSNSLPDALMIVKCVLLILFLSNRQYDRTFYFLSYSVINAIDAVMLIPNIDLNALFTRGARGNHFVFGVRWTTNTVCTMFAFSLFFLFVLFMNETNKRRRILYLLLAVPMIASILLLGSRQAVVIAAGSILLYFFWKDKHRLSKTKILGLLAIILILGVAIWYIFHNTTLYQTIGKRLNGADIESDMGRINLIKTGFSLWKKHPFFGTGLGSFYILSNHLAYYSHNTFTELLVSCGLIGFILYHLMVLSPIMGLRQNRLPSKSKSVGFILVLMIVFSEMVIVTYLMFQYYFILFNAYSISNEDAEGSNRLL